MRIVIFTPYLYPFHIDMFETLRKLRSVQDVKLFTTGTYGNYPFENLLKYVKILKSIVVHGQRVLLPWTLFKLVMFRPHVVILFGIESVAGIMIYAILHMLGAKTVVIVEENYITNLGTANMLLKILQVIKRQLVRIIYRNADILVAESRASARYITEVLNVRRIKPIYVKPHGIFLQHFFNIHLSSDVAKKIMVEKLRLPLGVANKIWISFIGEPSYCKGADVLLDAALLISEQLSEGNYILLFPRNLPLLRDKRELKWSYAKKLIMLVRKNVIITFPALSTDLMPVFYKACDIVVLPSRLLYDTSSDRSPNVALEALASGRIIVASYVGGIPDIVGDAGILVRPNDPRSLAKSLINVIENIHCYKYLETLAIDRARKHFDIRVYTLTLLKLLLTCGMQNDKYSLPC